MERTAKIFVICFILLVFGMLGSAGASDVPGVTDDTIEIGGLAPLTGFLATAGATVRDSWQMYIDQVNEAGGVHGRKIKLIWGDTACVPAKSIPAIKKLLERDKVFALAGGLCSNALIAAIPIIEKEGVPFLNGNANADVITIPMKKNIFRVCEPPAHVAGYSMSKVAVEYFKAKKIGLLHHSDEYAFGMRDGQLAYLNEKGLKSVAHETFNAGDVDFTSQLTKLKKAGAEAILLTAWAHDGAKAVVQSKKMQYDPLWIGASPIANTIFQVMAAEAGTGVVSVWVCSHLETDTHLPVVAKWREEFRKRIGEKQGRPTESDMMNYSSAEVYVEGLRRAGTDLTRKKFIEALESIKGFKTSFLTEEVNFSADDHQGTRAINWMVNLPTGKRSLLQIKTTH